MKDLRQTTLENRYFLKNSKGECIESFYDMCKRVANALACDDVQYEDFLHLLTNCDFLPNSPTLMSAGVDNHFTLSACFVIPLKDSMESIFEAVKLSALISKMGGGCGYDFGVLRPKDSRVGSTQGVASGPLSFIEVFDKATETVKQGGKRRGANMGVMRIDHPDIEDFIDAKFEQGKFTNFNFSVTVTDKFMKAVAKNENIFTNFDGKSYEMKDARKLWNKICANAHKNGEPGVIFIDQINKNNPLKTTFGDITATNPCGEQPLYPNECCTLGSVNLSNMYNRDSWVDDSEIKYQYHEIKDYINWDKLKRTVKIGCLMLDNIIDYQKYPNKEFEKMQKSNRKIGLGVMGFADLLIKLKVCYGSQLSIEIAENIMKFIQKQANEFTEALVDKERNYKRSIPESLRELNINRRNATVTTIAPTGTLSIIAGCSSGIEPNFAFITKHNRMDEKFTTYHPLYQEYFRDKATQTAKNKLPTFFIKASDLTIKEHIHMQAIFQKYTDNAVSKTINMPNSATVEDVKMAYLEAYETGCKGVTVYRDGSRENQVLSTTNKKKEKLVQSVKERELPEIVEAKRIKIKTPEGKIFITISHVDNSPYEIFIHHPADTKFAEVYETVARLVSLALRSHVSVHEVLDQLEKSHKKYGSIKSVTSGIIKALKLFCCENDERDFLQAVCPECNQKTIVYLEGCSTCQQCGYTACV